jgi:gluconate 2-dehydrogenase gamma chain
MNRRDAIQRAGLVLGYAVSAPVLSGLLKGCKPEPELTYKPDFFSASQARIVSEVAEIIIPKTDTPGAKDVGVPGFIDKMLKECYKKSDQKRYLAALKAFEEEAKETQGDNFLDLDAAKQVTFIKTLNQQAVDGLKEFDSIRRQYMGKQYNEDFTEEISKQYGAPEVTPATDSTRLIVYFRNGNFNLGIDNETRKIMEVFRKPDARQFILTTKELTIVGFFTSEPGATQVLQYEAVPGAFKGCVPLAQVGKTWAT